MIQFVSRTVITAYVTAAACLIIANQTKHVFGLELESTEDLGTFWQIAYATILALGKYFSFSHYSKYNYSSHFCFLQFKLKTFPNVASTLLLSSLINFFFKDFIGDVQTLDNFDSSIGIFSLL